MAVDISPRSDIVASGGGDGVVRFCSTVDGHEVTVPLDWNGARVRDLAFSPHGDWFACCGEGSARVIDLRDLDPVGGEPK